MLVQPDFITPRSLLLGLCEDAQILVPVLLQLCHHVRLDRVGLHHQILEEPIDVVELDLGLLSVGELVLAEGRDLDFQLVVGVLGNVGLEAVNKFEFHLLERIDLLCE